MNKFRIWNKKSGNWIEEHLIHINGRGEVKVVAHIDTGSNAIICVEPIFDLDINHSTGKKDSSDELIYAADIVCLKFADNEFQSHLIGVVEWCDDAMFVINPSNEVLKTVGHPFELSDGNTIEIMGNKYEHPELMQQLGIYKGAKKIDSWRDLR